MSSFRDTLEQIWPGETQPFRQPSTEGMGAKPGFRPARSPAETRADETNRVAREMIDAEAEKRHEAVARLKAARLEREAQARAEAALEPPPKKKGRKKA